MNKQLLFTTALLLISFFSFTQYSVVLKDSVTSGIQFLDNNLHCKPNDFDAPVPSYEIKEKTDDNGLTFPAISLTQTVSENYWFTGAFPSIDYLFPNEIVREPGDTIIIEFDLFFSVLSGSGEAGRLNVSLVTGNPEGTTFPGITFPLASNFDQSPVDYQPWWTFVEQNEGSTTKFGLPTYHFWLFSGNYGPALSYGGDFPRWPGWNSGADGYYYNENADDNQSAVTYSSSDNYPLVPYVKKHSGGPYVSATEWMHYTWVITHEMIWLYVRKSNESSDENREVAFMAIPENETNIAYINEVHNTNAAQMPPAYKWYEKFNALRFYYASVNRNLYLSNLEITKTGKPVSTYAEFQNRPASQRRPKADAGNYDLPLFLYNGVEGTPTTVSVKLADGNPAHINDFDQGTTEFTSISSDISTATLSLTLTDLYMNENDTLLFEITDVAGGYYPTIGPNKFFELIIRPSGAEPVSAEQRKINAIQIWPNPANNIIKISNIENNATHSARIYDLTGKTVLLPDLNNASEIDISTLQQGVYFIKIMSDAGTITRKFVKR